MEITSTLLENLDHLGAWGILTTDTELKIVGWNRWLEKHSGKAASEVIGRHLFEAFPDLQTRSLDRYYRQALEGQAAILSQRFHKYLIPLPPTVGDSKLMQMQQTARISPTLADNAINGTLTLIEDVTERVVTEQELRHQAELLEEANRHKDEFLAMLAHELRNPLAPIRNGIRLLDMVASDSTDAIETRAMIERQVAHMARLIDDLLDVSRIARGKVRLQTEPCDLTTILRHIANDYRPLLTDNEVQLRVDLPDAPCWINGDSIRLAQVVSNLLQNATKFTNHGGVVQLSAKVNPQKQEVEVCVADDGIGMNSETVSRVFETFSQAETSLARTKGGLGLGLALVKGLTELHGGRVNAMSEGIDKGSKFRVYLPLSAAPTTAVTPTNDIPAPRTARKLLIIEDNRDTAISTKLLIKSLGFEVDVAFSGLDGIERARAFRPDIILCDIGLPEVDGYAVARALRSGPSSVNSFLIAQSGYGQVEDFRKTREAGFDLHLVKPVDFVELSRILKSVGPREQ